MILYFMRHGEAGPPPVAVDNEEDALTPAGIDALRAAAPLWRRLSVRPDAVLTSPLARARQSAEMVVLALDLARTAVIEERLRPGAEWADLQRALAQQPDARRVMFVGHEPDLSNAVRLLTGAGAVRLRKGGMACVEFPDVPEPGTGELAWLLDPDLYTA